MSSSSDVGPSPVAPEAPPPTRWRLVVEYHGARFAGWQVQPGARTVQGVIEMAGEALFGHPVRMAASGRTDAGVHALGQVVAFDARVSRSARAVRDGLNAHLPDDVAVLDATQAPSDFDPRRHAKRKLYRFTWLDRPARSPWWADRAVHVRRPLDVGAMDAAARALVGTHDVAAFRAVGCAARTTVRTIEACGVRRDGPLVHLEIVGNGFLRHMVRILAGTLQPVGHGEAPTSVITTALAERRRDAAGPTAPPHGLCLVEVRYDGVGAPADDDDPADDGT